MWYYIIDSETKFPDIKRYLIMEACRYSNQLDKTVPDLEMVTPSSDLVTQVFGLMSYFS